MNVNFGVKNSHIYLLKLGGDMGFILLGAIT